MSLEAKGRHLEASGKRAPFLDGPAMPEEAEHVWLWFTDLHAGRVCGFGPAPITWGDMAGFFALHGIEPRAWELRVLRAFDAAWLETNQSPGDEQDG